MNVAVEKLGPSFYAVNGRKCIGVTRPLQPFFDTGMAPEEAAFYMQRGSYMHNATAVMDLSLMDGGKGFDYSEIPEDCQGRLRSYEEWRNQIHAIPKQVELLVGNPRLFYGGTLDRVFVMMGALWLIDLKFSSPTKRGLLGTAMQTAAYKEALVRMGAEGAKHIRRGALYLPPSCVPVLKPFPLKNDARDFSRFVTMLNAYRLINEEQAA